MFFDEENQIDFENLLILCGTLALLIPAGVLFGTVALLWLFFA